MHTLAIIPARYASTRFPGKPLALLGGKPIVQWVYERTQSLFDEAVVATDDSRIALAVEAFGGKVCMTGSHHRSGTDRCGEVLSQLTANGKHYDIVVNVQGDEPFVSAQQINTLIDCFDNPTTQIATLAKRIGDTDELLSANNVKVVVAPNGKALYFSRQPIPYLRGVETAEWLQHHTYLKHIGIYAFRGETLREVVALSPSALEQAESLEQLRWIENGYTLRVALTDAENIGIDTPADLEAAEKYLTDKNNTL